MLWIDILYVRDDLNIGLFSALQSFGLQTIIVNDKTIYYNDDALNLSDVYTSYVTENIN